MSLRSKLDAWWYPGVEHEYDIAMLRDEVLRRLRPEMTVLDLGAGRGACEQLNFKGQATIIGADIDPVVMTNPNLDRAVLIEDGRMPGVEAGTVDLIFCSSVLEHVADPAAFLSEVHRVLKPGGVFVAKTPNKRHYMPVIAQATPLWFHKLYNRWRGRNVEDTFPTLYRVNTREAVAAEAKGAGLAVERIWTVESRPEYLRLTPPTYFVGMVYERLVNGLRLDAFKCVLFMALVKPG
jgi:SAM-dependent methyltransferase